ncbi:uncharacterized protein LOC121244191 [Juglans microcarpa x Juglans regia]|uniref:uncharacterized protein LOC121244191 n=1 Tax=Juglans microcarpa x Juglans regia TaxID=2249226 RepID=UPI001B7E661A|nr:uncharacterized protein LOC121244191 [Juglans microcarpa x Juglans regia]
MRISKKPVSFCLSLFSPTVSSRIPLHSGTRRVIRAAVSGASQLQAGHPMDESHRTSAGDKSPNVLHMTSSDGGHKPFIWSSSDGGHNIDIGKHIFCNRSLNMKNIVSVGFDMDYTLAQYKPETFESLAYKGTIKNLVYNLVYCGVFSMYVAELTFAYVLIALGSI